MARRSPKRPEDDDRLSASTVVSDLQEIAEGRAGLAAGKRLGGGWGGVVGRPAELVESRIARITRCQFRRIAPNREALNKNPNRESPINLARHLWCSGNGVDSMDICHGVKLLQNETVWANAAKMPPEAWYEMCVKPWHPELAMVGMRVLSQVISASCCERNWPAG